MGRFVNVVKGDSNPLQLSGVSVFMDCESPLVPWDTIEATPTSMKLGEAFTVEIPLATTIEAALGVDFCG